MRRTYDQGSSLFWLAFSASVMVESLRLGIGTARNPGTGFMAFGASLLLALLSLALLLKSSLTKGEGAGEPVLEGKVWTRVLCVLAALLLYVKVMPVVGYLITTFLLMAFLYWIVKGSKWWVVLVASLLTTILSYYIFSKWLNCQFPDGFFGL